MNGNIIRSVFAVAALCAAVGAQAATETVNGITWNYTVSDGKAEIYNSNSAAISSSTTGAITIPSTLGGYPVTSIGDSAFFGCRGLTSVTILDSVKRIVGGAFEGCSGLTSVTIGNGVTNIGSYAFSDCSGLTSVTILDGVTSIGSYAFSGCNSLTSVTIPDSVTSIGDWAFSGCRGLADANGFVAVRNVLYDYYGADGDVTIPGSVTNIGSYAFSDCSGLTSVTIGNGVTRIGNRAFSGCSGLASVTIPDSVKRIGSCAFEGCSGLTSVTIGNGVTSIGDGAFSDCSGLTSVTIPDSVKRIGSCAFEGCSGLTSVMIPNSVTNIVDGAFGDCISLASVTLPQCVCDINPSWPSVFYTVFYSSYQSITNIVIADGVTRIGNRAFSGCSGLASVTIPDSVKRIGSCAFEGCSGLTSVTIGNGVIRISYEAFEYCSGLTSVSIPSSVKFIGDCAFRGCSGLVSLMIGNGVSHIGDGAFAYCSGLASVTIPNSVTNIGGGAFSGCSGLTSVMIGNGVTSIGSYAFYDCSGLASVTMPDSVTSIGDCAFSDCRGLADANGFVVVRNVLYDYYGADGDVTIPGNVTSIGSYAFEGCGGLASVTVPTSVTNIGEYAFAMCSELKNVVLPTMYKNVNVYYDYDCSVYYVKDEAVNLGNHPWWRPVSLEDYLFGRHEYDDDVDATLKRIKITYKDVVMGPPLSIDIDDVYEVGSDGLFSLNLKDCMSGASSPKVTVKGLPSGIKYDSKTMTISGKATKPGVYKVTVSATNATVKKPVTKTFELVVPNLASEKLPGLRPETDAYGIVLCGVVHDADLIDCAPADGWTLKAAGLPAGLKLVQDKATGAYSITGVPTKAGTYTVTFTASKKGEKNQVATITLNVEALPTWAVGTFAGRVSAVSSKPPYQEYGSASMTVASNGKISGKIALLGTNWTFSATSFGRVESGNGELGTGNGGATFVADAVAKAGKATMPVVLRVASGGEVARDARPYLVNAKAEGVVGGTWSLALWRNMWKDKATATTAKAELAKWEGLYTLSLEDGGYLSLTVGKDGNVKASGKLSDGTKVSASSPLVYDEEYGWLAYFYTAPSGYKGGSFAIAVGFGGHAGRVTLPGGGGHAGRVTLPMGPARWTSRNPQATGAYGEGFSRTLDFFGAYYGKKPDVSAWSSATFDVEPPDGYRFDGVAPKVSVAQATGIFKGSCSFLSDGGGKAKKANFEGIVVLGAETQSGFYLWDAAGSYIDPKTGKPKTYKYKESHSVSLTR